jgi:hypothetical protein
VSAKTLKFKLGLNGMGTVTLDDVPLECRALSVKQVIGEIAEVRVTLFVQIDGEIMIDELVSVGPKPWPEAEDSA